MHQRTGDADAGSPRAASVVRTELSLLATARWSLLLSLEPLADSLSSPRVPEPRSLPSVPSPSRENPLAPLDPGAIHLTSYLRSSVEVLLTPIIAPALACAIGFR